MKSFLNLKLFLNLFVLFVILKMKAYTIFLPQNTPQSAFFGFPDNKESFEIINHFHLTFKYYLFKSQDARKKD